MNNDVIAIEQTNMKGYEAAPRPSNYTNKNSRLIQDNNYSTFNLESSLVITENTSQFDLYKGFFFIFISCLFKSFFSLFCKVLLENNRTITSFHLLAYKVYIMLAFTIILCLFILYTYYIKSLNDKTEKNSNNNFKNSMNNTNIFSSDNEASTNFNTYVVSEKDILEKNLIEKFHNLNQKNLDSDKNIMDLKSNQNQNLNQNVYLDKSDEYMMKKETNINNDLLNNRNHIENAEEIKTKINDQFYNSQSKCEYSSNINFINDYNYNSKIKERGFAKSNNFGSIFYLEHSDKLVFDIKRGDLVFVFLRSLFSVLSISLAIYALQHLNISNFFSVYYIYPAIVIILSFFILKEKIRDTDYICLISCFIGMIFIIRPEFLFERVPVDSNKNFYFIVIVSALFKSLEDIIIRNVGKDIHFLIIPFVYSLVGIILYPLILILAANHIGTVHISHFDLFLLALIALCSFAYQSFMALGIQNEKAGRASMINYLQIPLMFIMDLIIFKKAFVFYDILGTFIIFGFNFGNSAFIVIQRNYDWKKYKNNCS